jgi:hypothetical protein
LEDAGRSGAASRQDEFDSGPVFPGFLMALDKEWK